MREFSLEHACSRLRIAERILERHSRPLGLTEGLPVNEVFRLDVLEFLQQRLLAGDECRYKSRSPNTVNSTMAGVMAFARFCHKHGWIVSVPPVEKIEADEVMKGRPITEEEFQRMLDATPEVVGPEAAGSWQFALRVLWQSGLRIGDLMDLNWNQDGHIQPNWPQSSEQHATLLIPSTQKNRRVQEIPMLPGLATMLSAVPERERKGWIVNPVQLSPRLKRGALRPDRKDLRQLAKTYSNVAIARTCGVSETAVRKWIDQAGILDESRNAKLLSKIPLEVVRRLRQPTFSPPPTTKDRLSKERVGLVISMIGEAADVVVVQENRGKGRRKKYASAHDIRRGCAQRLINAGISAETLTLVMRHGDFATTMKHYGAVRSAQAAASELHERLQIESADRALVGGFAAGHTVPSQLSSSIRRIRHSSR